MKYTMSKDGRRRANVNISLRLTKAQIDLATLFASDHCYGSWRELIAERGMNFFEYFLEKSITDDFSRREFYALPKGKEIFEAWYLEFFSAKPEDNHPHLFQDDESSTYVRLHPA